MKRELTLADIAGYLPYDLKVQDRDQDIWVLCQLGNADPCMDGDIGLTTDDGGYLQYDYLDDILPVLRPMSDLYVEISERGYNNGEPFVPLVEFAKVRYPYLTSRRFITDTKYVECAENDSSGWGKWKMYELELESMSVDELDLLHRLHLDYRDLIDAGLAVSVHDLPTNPYEA